MVLLPESDLKRDSSTLNTWIFQDVELSKSQVKGPKTMS